MSMASLRYSTAYLVPQTVCRLTSLIERDSERELVSCLAEIGHYLRQYLLRLFIPLHRDKNRCLLGLTHRHFVVVSGSSLYHTGGVGIQERPFLMLESVFDLACHTEDDCRP